MWPPPGDSLVETIAAEKAIEDLYAEAFRRWAPAARAAVLPTLAVTAAASADSSASSDDEEQPPAQQRQLPPDPAALRSTNDQWNQVTDTVILAGILLLWAAHVRKARRELGTEDEGAEPAGLSDLSGIGSFDPSVLRIVSRAVDGMNDDGLREAAAVIADNPALREARDEMLAAQQQGADAVFATVEKKTEAAVQAVTLAAQPPEPKPQVVSPEPGISPAEPSTPENPVHEFVAPTPEQLVTDQRAAVTAALDPDGEQLGQIATEVSRYNAAGILNGAVLTAAVEQNQEFGEELDKTWIATLDGKTRPTHWACDGQRVPIDSTFTVGGEQLSYPGDPVGTPAEIANCRCRLGILGRDEQIPDEVDRHTERLDGRDSVVINRDGRTQQEEIDRRRAAGNTRARDNTDGIGTVASAAAQEDTMTAPVVDPDTGEKFLTFTDALFALTGTPTSDGRMLASDIDLSFRQTPLPLQWCERAKGGHDDAVTIGVIESLSYDNGELRASGYLLNNEHASKAMDLISHGVANPSVDLGGDVEVFETYADGTFVNDDNFDPDQATYKTITRAELMAATIVAIPAFGQTRISLNGERESRDTALVASAVAEFRPRVYEPQMFADPKLKAETRLTITKDGHVVGHLAGWKDLHRSIGLGKIPPPRSKTGYEHFHSSPGVHLSDGTTLPVGRLTIAIGHAPTRGVSAAAAQAHYDNVDTCWAIGRAGEDAHGIYFSGVVAPWASKEKVEMGLASPLSGDWRPLGPGGNLELVAVLGVNTPGFLCKVATDQTGRTLAMVASMAPVSREGTATVSAEVIEAVVETAVAKAFAAQAAFERATAVLARAHATVGTPPPPLTENDRAAELLMRASTDVFAESRMPAQFKKYWLSGAGAAQIQWGKDGDFARCEAAIQAKISQHGRKPLDDHEIKGLCATLHKEATGATPGHAPGESHASARVADTLGALPKA